MQKLQAYCNPRKNEVLESYRFWNKERGDLCDMYITQLRAQAELCNFKNKERMIRDKIVLSVEKKLQEKLLCYADLTLKQCLEIHQAYEQTTNNLREMNKETYIKMDQVEERKSENKRNTSDNYHEKERCRNCGRTHKFVKSACPAWGKRCNKCKQENHFAAQCKTPKHVYMQNTLGDEEGHLKTINVLNIKKRHNDSTVRDQQSTCEISA